MRWTGRVHDIFGPWIFIDHSPASIIYTWYETGSENDENERSKLSENPRVINVSNAGRSGYYLLRVLFQNICHS